jgi:hypothetical protein
MAYETQPSSFDGMPHSVELGDDIGYMSSSTTMIDRRSPPGNKERRTRARHAVSWMIYLKRSHGDHPAESRTNNFTCRGFYCYTREAFVPGESIRCTIVVPTFDSDLPHNVVSLECQATVLRVDALDPHTYGIGCRIDDYTVVRWPATV